MDNKLRIDSVHELTDRIIDYCCDNPDTNVVLVGCYDTVIDAFNILIKETDAEFVAGELNMPEWDGYEGAWYVDYSQDEIWVGKALNERNDKYLLFEADFSFVEEDFESEYKATNGEDNLVVFGYNDVEDGYDHEHHGTCLCLDEDKLGFTFCFQGDGDYRKFRFRGNHKLTEDEAWKMVRDYM